MSEYFIDVEEIPFYAWVIACICLCCIVAGIVLLSVKSRRTAKRKPLADHDGRAHRMSDVSFGFDTLYGREEEPEEEPEEENLPVFNQVDPTGQATPVGPYTSWDYDRGEAGKKQEASFAGFVQQAQAASRPQPRPESEPCLVRECVPEVEKVIAVESSPVKTGTPWDENQQLLLLKSHELLLTLTDGLKKLASAKTEASRKEKLSELLTAVKLLDAKSEWDEYKHCFEKIYPGFWNKVERASSEEMTPYELRLCALLSLGMGAKEIADLTNRSIRTVETSVYKIRKKLNAESEEKTQDFLLRIRNS